MHPVGIAGEDAAWEAYRRRGFRLIARNWRCPLGELDLVVTDGRVVAFCEVKARTGDAFGGPHDAVTPTKQRKVRALAAAFLASARTELEVRFDVASVTMTRSGPRVELFEDAF